jgi:hypothetical protein
MTQQQSCHFFRPAERVRRSGSLPADLFRLCRRARRRSLQAHHFVPIRSMQVLAVLGDDEIIFVDSLDYRVCDGVGGRLIQLAWRFAGAGALQGVDRPVPCEVIHYQDGLDPLQRRLLGEFRSALEDAERRDAPAANARILPFDRTPSR